MKEPPPATSFRARSLGVLAIAVKYKDWRFLRLFSRTTDDQFVAYCSIPSFLPSPCLVLLPYIMQTPLYCIRALREPLMSSRREARLKLYIRNFVKMLLTMRKPSSSSSKLMELSLSLLLAVMLQYSVCPCVCSLRSQSTRSAMRLREREGNTSVLIFCQPALNDGSNR